MNDLVDIVGLTQEIEDTGESFENDQNFESIYSRLDSGSEPKHERLGEKPRMIGFTGPSGAGFLFHSQTPGGTMAHECSIWPLVRLCRRLRRAMLRWT